MGPPIPPTSKAIRRAPITSPPSLTSPLQLVQTTEPTLPPSGLGPHDVLLRIRAVSLNYRDVLMLRGGYPGGVVAEGVPGSDCAGEVVAVGAAVTRFAVGDRASPNLDLANVDGEIAEGGHVGLGGDVDGVLREWGVWGEGVLVQVPGYLSWEEASTIACAGVTAWNAVNAPGSLGKGKSVLIQGTGGVSMFALLIALAGGFKPIITSSSDEKLETIRKSVGVPDLLGYNYRTTPDQAAEVKRLTNGKGVDIIVNNNGPAGIPADLESLAPYYGTISVVGFLAGMTADWNPGLLLGLIGKTAKIQGITCGSRVDYEALNQFFEEKKVSLKPLVDNRIFDFDDSQAAFDYLWSGKHVGKVVIRIP
ncbi:alcohol dehydrogenase [Lasiosphaeria hispida]|uniref:Alcohol dehydrogenase n=1 Tax=Lasiosphaeria hispida TaxID=260671 RepID=A0AAJ0HP42_9PEZI|nr:alcohol dehydrogenase [Lasiosphaeria hispida]